MKSILTNLELIASEKLRQRTLGLAQLREFLKRSQSVASLNSKGLKRTLDLVFDLVLKERSSYILGKRKNDVTDAGVQRLESAGEIGRLLISIGLTDFKSKACRQILNHITETLLAPTLEERLCMPLLDSYSKSFRMIVEFPAHVEHIPQSDIQAYLNFLCKSIDAIIESLGTSTDVESSIYLFSDLKPSASIQRHYSYAASELLQSIFHILNSASGIAINQMNDIWDSVGRYINSTTENSTSDQYAIAIANMLLNLASSRDLDFCEKLSLFLFERLPNLWSSKSLSVRENLLSFLQYSHPFMTSIVTRIDEAPHNIQDQIFSSISQMELNLVQETAFSSINLNLLTSDIDITQQSSKSDYTWFAKSHFRLKSTGNMLAWMTMLSYHKVLVLKHTMSFSSYASHKKKKKPSSNHFLAASSEIISLEHHIFMEFTNGLEASSHLVRNSQALIVHMQQTDLPEFLAAPAFNDLCLGCNSTDTEVTAWSSLAICHLLHQFPQFPFNAKDLDDLWNVTCKRFYHSDLSSISSFFLATMISQNRFPVTVRKPRIERLLGMLDSSGPQLSNGSIYLAEQLLSTYSLSMADKTQQAVEKLMFWLTANWQIDFENPTKSIISTTPGLISSLILNFCGIEYKIAESCQHHGPFVLAYLRCKGTALGLSYLTTGKISTQNSSSGEEKTSSYLKTSTPELISSILIILLEACNHVLKGIKNPDNVLKFASSPYLYERIINFLGSLFMTAMILGKHSQLFQAQCRELTLKVQLILKELCSTSRKVVLSDDHIKHILLGSKFLIELNPTIAEAFYMEVYNQIFGDLLTIFHQKTETTVSFSDEIKEQAPLLAIPSSQNLHAFNVLQATNGFQLYMTYTTIRLLHCKNQDQTELLEAAGKVFQVAADENEFVAMLVSFIDFSLPRLNHTVSTATALQKLMREIGEKLLSSYEWDRAESIMLFCIKILQDFVLVWTSNTTIQSDCLDILNWLCKLMFEGGYKNYQVQTSLSALLVEVMRHMPGLLVNGDKSLPGCFGLLIADSPDIIYSTSPLLPEVFKQYPITSHITFFNGIQDVLGRIHHQKETLAARCYLLLYLAKSSDSLLTGSIFNLLELTEFQDAQLYIKHGIKEISLCYKESSLHRFFQRQANELLYLWLSNGIANEFPFHYFDYFDKTEFLKENSRTLVFLLMHLKKSKSLPMIRQIGHSINAKNVESLLISALPKAWAYDFTDDNAQIETWLSKELGIASWKKYSRRAIPEFIASLMLLVDFSVISSDSMDSGLFGEIFGQITPATLVSFPQTLIKPERVMAIIQQVAPEINANCTSVNPNHFSFILRVLINKIVQSVDPIQKSINLRRLLFFASNYCEGEISGYSLEIMLKAIVTLISDPIAGIESITALQVLMERFLTSLTVDSDLFFEISLRCLHFAFQRKGAKSKLDFNFNWLQKLGELILEGPLLHTLSVLFSWLEVTPMEFKTDDFVLTFNQVASATRKVLMNIIAIEIHMNLELQNSFLHDIEERDFQLLDDISKIQPVPTRGYTIWFSRLLGKAYSSTGPTLLNRLYAASSDSLTIEIDPIRQIFSQIVQVLKDEDLEMVCLAEETLRYLHANVSKQNMSLLMEVADHRILEAMKYSYAPVNYAMRHFKFSDIGDSGFNTTTWIFRLCSTLILAISDKIPELECLDSLISKDFNFAKRLLPFIVHVYLKNCVAKASHLELDDMLNSCLNSKGNTEVNRLIIDTFFHLRANKLSKDRLGKRYFNLDIKAAVQSCLTNDLPDMALMLAEIDWSNAQLNDAEFRSLDLTRKIYEKISDPDMYYAIPIDPSLNGALRAFMHENNFPRLLQYQSAFLNEEAVLNESATNGLLPTTLRNTGMPGISRMVLDFMLVEDEETLYSNALKLQQWDLAYSEVPKTRDQIVFNLCKSLNSCEDINEAFYDVYNTTLSLLTSARKKEKGSLLETLAIIQESEKIVNVEDHESALKVSQEQLEISREWMEMSRYVILKVASPFKKVILLSC